MAQALWAAEPLDLLNNMLQHVDANSKAVMDATHPHGPTHKALLRLSQMLHDGSGLCELPLTFLMFHVEPQGADVCNEFAADARQNVLCIASQIWSLLYVTFPGYPWKLVCLVDPRTSAREKE